MDKGSKHDEESRQKIADAMRTSYASGERQHPIKKLRAEVDELKAWRERVRDVARRYRDLLAKGADSKNPELSAMCRDLLDALGS